MGIGMTKWLAGLAVVLAGSAGAQGNRWSVVLTDSAPPFAASDEGGKLRGFNVDLAEAICQRLRRECRIETLRFPEIVPAVAAGRHDVGVANLLRTPERERQVRFSRPVWRSTSSLIGPRVLGGAPVATLVGSEQTCAIAGSRQFGWLGERAARPPLAASGNAELLDLLSQARCALALLPTLQALPFLQSRDGQGFGYIGAPLGDEGLGGDVHLVVKPGSDELKAELDGALDALLRDGTLERLSRRHFPFSIF